MDNIPFSMKMRIESMSFSNVGMKRSNNEDWVTGFEPVDPQELEYSGCLYIVADGVGGASKGERASQYAAQKVLYEYFQHPKVPPAERLAALIRKAGNEIYQHAVETGTPRMATTLVAAIVRNGHLTVANVGDSRAYLIRNGTATQISQDHNLANELIRNGAMTPEEARHSKTKNKLMRSLGGEADVDVDVFPSIQLLPGDLILLCTDGLTRYAEAEDLARLAAYASLEQIGEAMITFANQAGGADNITLHLIKIQAGAEEPRTIAPGDVPQPVDWDTMQTQASILPMRIRVPWFSRRQKVILSVLVAMLVIVIVGGGFVLSELFNPSAVATETVPAIVVHSLQPTHSPGPAALPPEQSPTPASEMAGAEYPPPPTQELSPAQTDQDTGILTPSQTPSPSPEPPGVCVHQVQSGESIGIIYGLYDPDLVDDGPPDEQFTQCTLESRQCAGPAVGVENRDVIVIGNFLQLPVTDKTTCESVNNSYWVTVIP